MSTTNPSPVKPKLYYDETKTPINRYTRGFGFFGPLEQCDDGELMKSDDVLHYIGSVKRTLKASHLQEANDLIKSKNAEIAYLVEQSEKTKKKADRNMMIAFMPIPVLVACIVILINIAMPA